jgi:hypothetical protein
MEARTEARTGAAGRRDSQGTIAIPKKVPQAKIDELVQLHRKKTEANDAYNEGVKKMAEKHGMNSAVISKLVSAHANDKVQDEKNKIEQMAFAFGIVDEIEPVDNTTED